MRIWMVLLLCLLVTGCASEEELAARDAAKCQSFGFKPETEPYANCRLQLYKNRTRHPEVIQQSTFPPRPAVIVVPEKK